MSGEDPLETTAARLRAALAREAEQVPEAVVRPGHGRLEAILARSRDEHGGSGPAGGRGEVVPLNRSRSGRLLPLVAAAAAVVALAGGVALTERLTSTPPTAAARPVVTSTGGPSSSPGAEPGTPAPGGPALARKVQPESPSSSTVVPSVSDPAGTSVAGQSVQEAARPEAAGARTVPVYWIGASRTRSWLYREFLDAGSTSAGAAQALRLMLAGAPLDPDYSSPWAAGQVTVTLSPSVVTVDLPSSVFRGTLDATQAQLALQQLVYTATAAAKDSTDTGAGVRVLVDGKAGATVWGGALTLPDVAHRDPSVVAPIWIIDPQQGQVLHASPVTIDGVGTAFEGQLSYSVVSSDGTVVASGTTVGGSTARAPFTITTPLRPGTYTVTVWAPDVSNGTSPEGPQLYPDTKTFTLR